jgi:hypothetical protein
MITITLKLILQIINVTLMGYLAVAFFQKLFCRDIGTIDYKRFIHDRRLIWSRFKRAFKSQKYRSFILFCFLCLLGFSLAVRDLSIDWELNHKNISWQVWNILFCYAVYLSQSNMKLKLFYDLLGKTPTKTKIISMETPKNVVQMKQQMDKEVTRVINYKRAFQYMWIILAIAILCCGYAFYAMRKSDAESRNAVDKQRQYSVAKDSIISAQRQFQDSINLVVNSLKRENDSLLIRRTAKMANREEMLKKPIDYSNEAERKAILDELMKEAKR